jgi:hypothetical protein
MWDAKLGCIRIVILITNDQVVAFEVFMAVTVKNSVFCYVTPCGRSKKRGFGGTYRLHHQGDIR